MTKREYQAADYAAELNESEQEANDVKIADVELSTRAKTALKKIKVQTLRQLAQIDENSIKGCHNGLGLKTFEELKKLLEKMASPSGWKRLVWQRK
jgi:DNA-directed RNA polymerase alpha subunit